jgi:hypothetical protein
MCFALTCPNVKLCTKMNMIFLFFPPHYYWKFDCNFFGKVIGTKIKVDAHCTLLWLALMWSCVYKDLEWKRNKICYTLLQICWNGIVLTSVITLSCYLQCRKKLLQHFWNIKVNHKWSNQVSLLKARLEVSSWRKPWEWKSLKEVCRNQ